MRISELSNASQVAPKTIRDYESIAAGSFASRATSIYSY